MNNDSYIYFIEQEKQNFVKIGFATNIKNRLGSLQTGSPYNLILRGYIKGDRNFECELHLKFKNYNIGGEWFTLSDEIKEFINNNCNKDYVDYNTNRRINIKTKSLTHYDNGSFKKVYINNVEKLELLDLNNNEKLVYYVLRDYAQYPTNCVVIKEHIPTMAELEPIVGLSERSIRESLKSLDEKRLIKLVQSGHRKAIYINPEYYATGKELDTEVLHMFGLIQCDDEKVNEYLKVE